MNKNYQEILDNFEEFCDGFEAGAALRFSGRDIESRQAIDHKAVERAAPAVVRQIDTPRAEDFSLRSTSIDVQASEVGDS